MKRILIATLAFIFITNFTFAQHNDLQVKSIKRRLEKIEQKLQTPDGAKNYKYWLKKAKTLLDAYEVNIQYVSPGMQAKLIPLVGGQEGQPPFYGKPKKIETEGDKEYWVYDKVTFIVQNGHVIGWKITKPVVNDPLEKAYDAYIKAIKLDPKGKLVNKSSTKRNLAKIRDYLKMQAIEYYQEKNYNKALKDIEMAMDLYKYPRMKDDTVNMKPGQLEYYAGIIAYNAGKYDKAAEYFKKAIDKKYEVGTSYQLLTQSLKKIGREQEAVKLLEEGAKKFPTESKIIFALIDYYTPRGQLDKAFYYLDKALKLNPNMASLYFVKASAYEKIYKKYAKQYMDLFNKSDSLKKAAFRARYQKKEHARLLAEKDSVDKILAQVKQQMDKYFDLAEQWYKQGIAKDPKNPDGYNYLGAFYYDKAMNIFEKAQSVPTSDTETYNKYMEQYKHYLNLSREQFEKALELTPNDLQTIQNLAIIYYKLHMHDKYKEMRQRYEQIKKSQQNQQQSQGQQK